MALLDEGSTGILRLVLPRGVRGVRTALQEGWEQQDRRLAAHHPSLHIQIWTRDFQTLLALALIFKTRMDLCDSAV